MVNELSAASVAQLPFEVNYDGVQRLFHMNRVFEQPDVAQITVIEANPPIPTGRGPFFR